MRDFVPCLGHHAVRVAGSACSGSSISSERPPQSTVSCCYRAALSTHNELLIKVTWHKNNRNTSVLVVIEENPGSGVSDPRGTTCQLLMRKKGSQSFAIGNSEFALHWDISAATYGAGAEPTRDFYLVMMADKVFVLLLGDMWREFINKFEDKVLVAASSMYSRREQVFGATLYSTKAQFRDGGKDHEIMVRCKGDEADAKDAELYVCVDRKRLLHVKRVMWNFRGNQTIFVDGSAIDVLWDVHDWWFRGSPSGATFMFRARSAIASRLWSEEELAKGASQFTLLIQAFKTK